MPAGPKSCRLCGSANHTLPKCTQPGAKKFRELLKAERQDRGSAKSRYVRKDGVHSKKRPAAAVRKKPAKRTVSKRAYSKKATKQYSGETGQRQNRKDRSFSGPNPVDLTPEEAVETMLEAGFLRKPDKCPICHVGRLQGPFANYNVSQKGSLHWRCDNWECKRWRVLDISPYHCLAGWTTIF